MPNPAPQAAPSIRGVLDPIIPQVAGWIGRNPDTLSLAQGMVSWSPPDTIGPSLIADLQPHNIQGDGAARLHRYGEAAGDPELLQRLASVLRAQHQLDLDGAELWVTAGSNMAFQLVVRAICDPGDAVIVPLPWYFNHAMAIQLAGAEPVGIEAGMIPDPERLEAAITSRTRAIVTVSPGNPSGVVIPPDVLAAIGAICSRHGLFHLSDEAYALFVHGDCPHWSPGSAPGSGAHTVTFQSMSKAYGMAGWRLGYAAIPRQLNGALRRLQDTVLIAPPRIVQRAALVALNEGPGWCQPRVAGLLPGRRSLIELPPRLQARGLEARLLAAPDGAFYGLLEVASPWAGEALVERLIRQFGVATLPGESFGWPTRPGTAVLRLSYGMLHGPRLDEALDRLIHGLVSLRQA